MSHTTAKPRQADTSFDSQTMIGRQFESDPAGAHDATRTLATSTNYSSRQFCSSALGLKAENEAPNSPLRDNLVVLRLGTIVLGADDVDRAAAFWAGVLGYEVIRFAGSSDDFTILVPPDRVGTCIAVHRSVTLVQERPRVHLDLVVDSASEQSFEVDRLVELGATRVSWDYSTDNADVVVLADTEGNRFCIVDASQS